MADAIKIQFQGLNGAMREAYIQPLTRKNGVYVLHKVLSVFGNIDSNAGMMAVFKELDFDSLWDLASRMLTYAVIDGKQCKTLDDFDGFDGHFGDLYALVFEALQANFPDFFGRADRGDLTGSAPVAR